MRDFFLFVLALLFSLATQAQNAPIGSWDSHLPYNTAVGVATDGNNIYTFCNQAFFAYDPSSGQQTVYSKIDGMTEIGMQCGGYDKLTNTLILVYNSGSIDLYRNNTFVNIPDIKRISNPEEKKIYQVYTDNGFAYLSSSLGVIVIDLEKEEIEKTYKFQVKNEIIPVYSFAAAGGYFYAATRTGLYRAAVTDPQLQNTATWKNIFTKDTFSTVINLEEQVFFGAKKKIYMLKEDSVQSVFTAPKYIQQVSSGKGTLLIGLPDATGGKIQVMNKEAQIIDSFNCADSTVQALQLSDNSIWLATPKHGLKKWDGANITTITPDGPANPYAFDIYAYNRDLYIAHGGYNNSYFATGSLDGFSNLKEGKWTFYRSGTYPPVNGIRDISSILLEPKNGTLYAGSYLDGLFVLNKDGSSERISNNSLFDVSIAYGWDSRQIMGLTLDKQDNLWVTCMFAIHQLYVKTADGTWYKYYVKDIPFAGGPAAIDDSGQVWVPGYHISGLAVINTKNTITDTSDDDTYRFTVGKGFGNLPGSTAACVVKDLNNDIWVGTDNGIAIFRNCIARAGGKVCDAEWPVIEYNGHSGPLLQGDYVKTIAIDVTGKKWIGTRTSGVWLLSANGKEVLQHFTEDNSPLPSDYVQKISIDNATGDVYIGTDKGLVSYRGMATEGGVANKDVMVFPNPVPSGYSGAVAIKGLVQDADVRITDISGNLVYHGKAQGGQMVWDGKDHTGHRPQSGVYLFFVSDKDGKQTYTGKVVFIQ